ncbi:bacteriocin biosynthesis docking scaffold, SagD family [Chlamydia abortus]|nr:bacteriocin biosynthesis docking scaffold, SagD family [Chlamydia abortus]
MNPVVIVGNGRLADAVCKQLSGLPIVHRPDFGDSVPAAGLVWVVQDQSDSALNVEAEKLLRPRGLPWSRACLSREEGEGRIGPLVLPGKPGCFQCAETRLSLAGGGREEPDDSLMKLISPDAIAPSPLEVPPAAFRHMALIVSLETARLLRGEITDSEGRIHLINLRSLTSTVHYILPDGLCPVCGELPDDSPEAAAISLEPCKKLNNSYRCRSMGDLRKVLAKDYLDNRTGLMNGKRPDLASAFAGVAMNLPLGLYNEVVGGHSNSYADSEMAAILEGLERFCGLAPRGKRTIVSDSYSRLKEVALDPAKVGFHAKELLEQPDFPFQSFDPDTPMDWVWGYSFLQERPILVPERLAYYSLGYGGGFVYETSNGCAIGGSLEEAILHGIFEVVERDSFLMTWYTRLPVPQLDPGSAEDQELLLMIHRLRAVTGYEVCLYNTTMENGIPSIWALAKGGKKPGVNLLCAAGVHLDPVRAAKSAIHELANMIPMAEARYKERRPEAESMFKDSFLVESMEDHALLYSLPQAEERLRFLLDERRPLRTFAEEFQAASMNDDLTEDLKQVLRTFRSLRLDVIVIDQSSGETLRNGLRCVKVLIPGMLPMTFGHRFARLTGLDRVFEVPMKLGYAEHKLTPEELNPYPHPFP